MYVCTFRVGGSSGRAPTTWRRPSPFRPCDSQLPTRSIQRPAKLEEQWAQGGHKVELGVQKSNLALGEIESPPILHNLLNVIQATRRSLLIILKILVLELLTWERSKKGDLS